MLYNLKQLNILLTWNSLRVFIYLVLGPIIINTTCLWPVCRVYTCTLYCARLLRPSPSQSEIIQCSLPSWLLSCQHPEEGGTKPSVLGLCRGPGGTWTCFLVPGLPVLPWASQPLLFQYHLMKLIRYFAPWVALFLLNWYIDLYSFTKQAFQQLERGKEILLQWQF